MTEKEAIERIEKYQCKRVGQISERELEEALELAIETLKIQDESKTKNIIYDFLTAKLGEDIMNNPFEFEDWFNRMVWHVQECYRLNKKLLTNTGGYDIINRQTVIQIVHDYFKNKLDELPTEIDENGYEIYSDISKANEFLSDNKHLSKKIKDLPSAKPKRGKWIKKEHLIPLAWDAEPLDLNKYDEKTHSELQEYWHCSECDYEADRCFRPSWEYCPNCGSYNGGDEID